MLQIQVEDEHDHVKKSKIEEPEDKKEEKKTNKHHKKDDAKEETDAMGGMLCLLLA